jgi:hypothetical protein
MAAATETSAAEGGHPPQHWMLNSLAYNQELVPNFLSDAHTRKILLIQNIEHIHYLK